MRDIRGLSRRIAEEFRPSRIILFGSHARGKARDDSDVDLLVMMPYRGHPIGKAVEIVRKMNPRFSVDVIVRSPAEVREGLAGEDALLVEIMNKGRVLYEGRHARVG
jgi:predicted nucleotidyltransferase